MSQGIIDDFHSIYTGGIIEINHCKIKHGYGILKYRNNAYWFEGNWENDVKCGYGVCNSDDGVYKGNFVNDLRHGYGVLTSPNGNEYKGEWMNDKCHGYGTYTYNFNLRNLKYNPNTNYEYKWTGHWTDDELNGYGVMLYSNGDKYMGNLRNSRRHGKGMFEYSNGHKQIGNWKNNLFHGYIFHLSKNKYNNTGKYDSNTMYGNGFLCSNLNNISCRQIYKKGVLVHTFSNKKIITESNKTQCDLCYEELADNAPILNCDTKQYFTGLCKYKLLFPLCDNPLCHAMACKQCIEQYFVKNKVYNITSNTFKCPFCRVIPVVF